MLKKYNQHIEYKYHYHYFYSKVYGKRKNIFNQANTEINFTTPELNNQTA